jgi:DNA-binding response OmpR family regulator
MKIAIADDDDAITDYIRGILEGGGHHCTVFRNGTALVTQLQRDTFDLIVLDWSMPGMTGIEILGWIQQSLAVPPAVIMLTSRSGKDDIANALAAGADDYIVKPEASNVIAARVGAVLRRAMPTAPQSAPRVLEFGGYSFDRMTETVAFNGEEVALTAKEFALALLFFQNMHRALSRAYILQTLWNSVADLPTRTLDMHVSRIRTKLQLKPEHGYRLFTIFSYGYRLESEVGAE